MDVDAIINFFFFEFCNINILDEFNIQVDLCLRLQLTLYNRAQFDYGVVMLFSV